MLSYISLLMYSVIQYSKYVDSVSLFNHIYTIHSVFVGPYHHGMARPQVADGGMVSDMEGSCE